MGEWVLISFLVIFGSIPLAAVLTSAVLLSALLVMWGVVNGRACDGP